MGNCLDNSFVRFDEVNGKDLYINMNNVSHWEIGDKGLFLIKMTNGDVHVVDVSSGDNIFSFYEKYGFGE